MVRLLGLTRGQSDELPREITSRINRASDTGENGWLIRFFDSAFFCEWIAVSYLYKHDHSGVRDYLCNRMYTLPLPGIESYLFQICYMMVHKPSPSLDKFVIDTCSKSLKIALKVHWFLMAEIEDSDDNEGINRIQEKCQIAATLMGEWLPLKQPQTVPPSPGSKNLVFNKLLSSKQRLLSLTSSPPFQKSLSFSPSPANNLQQDGSQLPSEENSILKKFIPSPKLLFRKSTEKDDDGLEKDGFFKRLLRDSRGDDEAGSKVRDMFLFRKSMEKDDDDSEKDGFFKRLLRDSRGEDEELTASSESLFKRLFRDSKSGSEDKSAEDDEKEGFFRKLFKEKFDNKKDGNERKEDGDIIDSEAKCSKSVEDDEKEGFFRKLFKDKSDDKKNEDTVNFGEKSSKSVDDDEKEGFFRKFFKDKFEDKKDANDKTDEGCVNCEEEEASDFSLLRRVFRVHPEDSKITVASENNNGGGLLESSPGTESFFRKLFRDRDRSMEDSELFGSKKHKEKYPGSPKQRSEKSNAKPPLPNDTASQFRKGAYHESLEFVQSLCETSYGLVDVFPAEDRKSALRESLAEINLHVGEAQNNGGVCFPMGKGMYRVASLHSIKSRYPNISSLHEFFIAKYGENSPSFKLAQRNFVESMAGYSLVCYLLQVKDRHNGNLLLDEEGHIIHIDFGFMLSNSPGDINFESAPFKLTRELLEVMDSDAEGVPSEFFDYFKVLCIQGFLTCRKHAERIILLVEMLQDSDFPCFKGGPRTIQNLRKRFHLSLRKSNVSLWCFP
ncbi:hypothetical protein I3843_03G117600 [Carya illinoinensis]|nr:hypothetical protein I3843_03G117600 [Carya illinoinensis]